MSTRPPPCRAWCGTGRGSAATRNKEGLVLPALKKLSTVVLRASAAIVAAPASGTAASWPTPTSSKPVSATIAVNGVYDGGMKRFYGTGPLGTGGQNEDQDPIFDLAPGST